MWSNVAKGACGTTSRHFRRGGRGQQRRVKRWNAVTSAAGKRHNSKRCPHVSWARRLHLEFKTSSESTCAASKASVCHRHGVQRCAEKLVVAMSVLALSAADLPVHCCESRGVRLPSRLSFCWHSVVYSSDGRVVCCPLGSAGCQSSVSPSALSLETAVYHMNCKPCNCRCGSFGRGLRLGCRFQLWLWSSPGLSLPWLL